MIQERPVAALAFALGFGFLIGVTWRPRERRKGNPTSPSL